MCVQSLCAMMDPVYSLENSGDLMGEASAPCCMRIAQAPNPAPPLCLGEHSQMHEIEFFLRSSRLPDTGMSSGKQRERHVLHNAARQRTQGGQRHQPSGGWLAWLPAAHTGVCINVGGGAACMSPPKNGSSAETQ